MQTLTNHKEINAWLDSMGIVDYIINDDGGVTVLGNVDLSNRNLSFIPVQFVNVQGWFDVSCNSLVSLSNTPDTIGKWFDVHNNNLTTLVHGPQQVGRSYDCSYNKLSTTQGAPKHITLDFDCRGNDILDWSNEPYIIVDRCYKTDKDTPFIGQK